MKPILSKKAAMELSIGTIVIIVLAMSMLIFGIILIRTIMCGALGLTGDINSKVRGEIQRLFQSEGGEVVCIGSGAEAVSLIKEKTNAVYCSIKAPVRAEYNITITDISGEISETEVNKWIIGNKGWKGYVNPGEENNAKKILRIKPPKEAQEGLVVLRIEVERDGKDILTDDLDFEVRSVGWLSGLIC